MQGSQRQAAGTTLGEGKQSLIQSGFGAINHGSRTSKILPKKSLGPLDGRYSVLVNEIGVPSPSIKKTIPAFELVKDGEMPTPGDNRWTMERLEQLMKKPSYKPLREKNQILAPHLRNNSPMTMEDKSQAKSILTDKILRGSLRVSDNIQFDETGAPRTRSLKPQTTTNVNPPSFFQQDLEKWDNRFKDAVKERQDFKKKYYLKDEITPITVNTNLQNQELKYKTTGFHTKIGFIDTVKLKTSMHPNVGVNDTEYKRVMERRKSRQSVHAPTVVDVDYAGDAAKFEHIINHRNYFTGHPNASIINYGMKLRNYKNVTTFEASQPFVYPPKRVFHPSYAYDAEREKIDTMNKEYATPYNDRSPQKNLNTPLTVLDKHFGVYHNTFWIHNLRAGGKQSKQNSGKPPLHEGSVGM